MKKICLVLLVVLNVIFVTRIQAQMTLYFMDRLPQSQQYNPAFIPKNSFYIELPVVGFEQVELSNSGFRLGQLLDFSDQLGSSNYDPDEFVNSIGATNKTTIESRSAILSFGFRLKKTGYISMGLCQRNYFDLTAPSKIVYLTEDAEKIREKMPLLINGINLRMNVFSQFSVGFAKLIGEKLTVGISPKLIGAMGGIYAEQLSLELQETAPGEFEQNFDGQVQLGLPVPINPQAINDNGELDPDEDILDPEWGGNFSFGTLFQNPALAVDLGMNYQLNQEWSFSASILDLGKSSWKKYGYDLSYDGDVAKVKDLSKMKMKIPSKIFLGVNYGLSTNWNAGFLFRNVFYESGNYSSATLSLNGYVGRMLSTSFSYTAGHSFNNLGLGFRLRFLPGTDLYLVTDNILQAFNYKNIQYSTIAFGINLTFGKHSGMTPDPSEEESIQ